LRAETVAERVGSGKVAGVRGSGCDLGGGDEEETRRREKRGGGEEEGMFVGSPLERTEISGRRRREAGETWAAWGGVGRRGATWGRKGRMKRTKRGGE